MYGCAARLPPRPSLKPNLRCTLFRQADSSHRTSAINTCETCLGLDTPPPHHAVHTGYKKKKRNKSSKSSYRSKTQNQHCPPRIPMVLGTRLFDADTGRIKNNIAPFPHVLAPQKKQTRKTATGDKHTSRPTRLLKNTTTQPRRPGGPANLAVKEPNTPVHPKPHTINLEDRACQHALSQALHQRAQRLLVPAGCLAQESSLSATTNSPKATNKRGKARLIALGS